jgi:hypothetical protein
LVKRLGHFLVWSFLFILVLLAIDLSLIYIPSQSRGFNQVRKIYLDFRFRLLGFSADKPDSDLDEFLHKKLSERGLSRDPAGVNGPRFFYVDKDGDIRFVADLEKIPPRYRSQAQKLDR